MEELSGTVIPRSAAGLLGRRETRSLGFGPRAPPPSGRRFRGLVGRGPGCRGLDNAISMIGCGGTVRAEGPRAPSIDPSPPDVKYGLGILLTCTLVSCALWACRVEVGHAGDSQRRGHADEPESVVDDGSGGRWDYLLANTRRTGAAEAWDGSRDGPVTEWYDDGTKREEGAYKNNLKVGKWTFWYPNGQKRWEGTYDNGRPTGLERAWYENGSKRYEGPYENGERSGPFTFWHDNAQKWFEGEYSAGLREGNFRFWNRDGSIDESRTGFYLRGEKVSG